MKKLIYITLFILPLFAVAQNIDRTKSPLPGKAPLIQVADPVKFTLANGLQVFVVKNTKLPRVSATLALDIDGIKEGEKAGLADLAGQLLKRGTEKKSKAELDEAVEYLGGSLATSSRYASVSSLKNNFPKLMDLLSEVILHPALSSEELEKLRTQTISAIEASKDEPDAIAGNVVNKLVYGANHAYGEITTVKTVTAVKVEDVKNYVKNYWIPNNAYLIFVGDIEPAAAKALAEKNFSSWAKGTYTRPKYEKPAIPATSYIAIVDRPASVQSVVSVASTVNLTKGSPNDIPSIVMNNILGGGSSGRLFLNLREKHGFTYGAYSSIRPDYQIGFFKAESSVRNEKTDSAIQEILNELNTIRNSKVGDTELSQIKNYLAGGFARSLEDPATIANFALSIAVNHLPADYYQKYLTTLAAVNASKVQEVATALLNPAKMHIVIIGNAKQIAKGLEKYGPVKYFDIEGNEMAAPVEAKVDLSLTPAALMEKAIAAVGSKEALDNLKDVQLKGTASVMGQSLEMKQTILVPGNSVTTMSMGGMAIMRQAVVDGKYSVSQQGQEAPMTDDLKEGLDESAFLAPEQLYLAKGYGLKIIGGDKVGGKEVIDVEVTTPSKKLSHRFYDAKTFLLLKTSKSEEVPGRGTMTQQQFYNAYQTVNGIQIPSEMIIDMGQMKINVKYTDIKVNQGLKITDLK
ncbi:MAG: pitrilysin family protein [Bacteroidetes bacterium]|nr:pitrilysin family protein [Bacteroidota bacterium]